MLQRCPTGYIIKREWERKRLRIKRDKRQGDGRPAPKLGNGQKTRGQGQTAAGLTRTGVAGGAEMLLVDSVLCM